MNSLDFWHLRRFSGTGFLNPDRLLLPPSICYLDRHHVSGKCSGCVSDYMDDCSSPLAALIILAQISPVVGAAGVIVTLVGQYQIDLFWFGPALNADLSPIWEEESSNL